MDKLQKLLEKFRNDKDWNTENHDGTHRFDKELLWIESMILDYASKLNLPIDKVVELVEGKRDYSWPNYYQSTNFPPLDSNGLIGVFETFEDFRSHAQKHYKGYRCGQCGEISVHPQECLHKNKRDGKCDWTSYGLFRSGFSVIILENGLSAIPIFEPALKDGLAQAQ